MDVRARRPTATTARSGGSTAGPSTPIASTSEVQLGDNRSPGDLRNDSDLTHYVHIHAEQWRTVSRDGVPTSSRGARASRTSWKLDPGEDVVVAARFEDYTGPFMVHCHMLDHEDHGMMARFNVVP